jgi:NitT/TauT family transport system substrate-binding protein
MRKIFILIISVALLAFSSCKEENKKIRIGVLPVIDTLPLVVAQSENIFKEAGVDVELVNFNSALERDAALASGNLDGQFCDLVAALLQMKSGVDIKIVLESYHTSPDNIVFALLASPNSQIKTIGDIGNNEVAISIGSVIEYFLDRILLSNNLDPSQVKRVEVKAIPVRMQMLMSDSLKLALLPEPLASKAIKGGAKLIADDRKLDTSATVIVFKKDFIEKNSLVLSKFLIAYNRAVEKINKNSESYKDLMVSKINFPVDLKESYKIPFYKSAALPSERDIKMVNDWLQQKGMISQTLDYKSITWFPEKL